MICNKCGKEFKEEHVYCGRCGTILPKSQPKKGVYLYDNLRYLHPMLSDMLIKVRQLTALLSSWSGFSYIEMGELIEEDNFKVMPNSYDELSKKLTVTTQRISFIRLVKAYYVVDLCILSAAKIIGDENYINHLYKKNRNGFFLFNKAQILEADLFDIVESRMECTRIISVILTGGRYGETKLRYYDAILKALYNNLFIFDHLYFMSKYSNMTDFIIDVCNDYNSRGGTNIKVDPNSYFIEDLNSLNKIRLDPILFLKIAGNIPASIYHFINIWGTRLE
ncbi:MAG: hypothetical protein WCQ41_09170 [Bacillota bacterium]